MYTWLKIEEEDRKANKSLFFRHLLITRPTESVALEHYIIDACEKSTHIAVMVC